MEIRKRDSFCSFGKVLLDRGIINQYQLDEALEIQRLSQITLRCGEILKSMGAVSDEHIVQVLSSQYRLPYFPVSNYEITPEILRLIPAEIIYEHYVLPIEHYNNVLVIATSDPLNPGLIEKLERITQKIIQIVITTPKEIEIVINRYFMELANSLIFS